jgi:hypothetical protein
MNQAEVKWPMKDRIIFFLAKVVLVPMVFIAVMIFAIREEISHRRSYGRKGSLKQSESSSKDLE